MALPDAHLRDLRYFVAVADELSFTRAAERLYLSQPALSKQVRSLERQLGFALLRREPSGVTLTQEGAALLPHARDLLAAWAVAWQEARGAAATERLVLGLQTAVGRDLLRDGLARARRVGCEVTLRLVDWSDPSAGLLDGSSDLAVLWLPLRAEGVATRTLVSEDVWVALPADHPLAGRDEVGLDDLLDEAFVALPEEAGALRDFWLAADERRRRGAAPARICAVAQTADAALEAVAAMGGVALLSSGNVALYPRPGVICRPVRDLGPARLALAWLTDERRAEVRQLVAALVEATGGR